MTLMTTMVWETTRQGVRGYAAIDAAVQTSLNRAAARRADCREAVEDLAEALGHSRRATAQARAETRRACEERDAWQREAAAATARAAQLEAALRLAAGRIHQLQA